MKSTMAGTLWRGMVKALAVVAAMLLWQAPSLPGQTVGLSVSVSSAHHYHPRPAGSALAPLVVSTIYNAGLPTALYVNGLPAAADEVGPEMMYFSEAATRIGL